MWFNCNNNFSILSMNTQANCVKVNTNEGYCRQLKRTFKQKLAVYDQLVYL